MLVRSVCSALQSLEKDQMGLYEGLIERMSTS